MDESSTLKSNLLFTLELTLACLLVFIALCLDCIYFKNSLSELSVTEISQQLLLLSIASRFFIQSRHHSELNKACFFFSMLFLVFFIRELDHWLDYILHGFWKYPALLIIGYCLFAFFSDVQTSLKQINLLLEQKYAQIFIFGLVTLLIFSRIAGMGVFWKAVMDEHYMRIVKNIVEEGIELFSYNILALSSFKITQGIQHCRSAKLHKQTSYKPSSGCIKA